MRGQLIQVIPRQLSDFTYLSPGASEARVVLGRLPTVGFNEATLLVRCHSNSIDPNGAGKVTVSVVVDASTPEDPDNTFLGASAVQGGAVTLDGGSAAGSFTLTTLTGDLGAAVALKVVAAQDAASALSLAIDFSADLVFRAT